MSVLNKFITEYRLSPKVTCYSVSHVQSMYEVSINDSIISIQVYICLKVLTQVVFFTL